jgi:EAL domain-containing protein (putative c-di-GMP-specific phosphodiesterase class I)
VIVDIGAWALDDVCAQAAGWQPLAPNGFRVFVNLSSRQLADPNAVALIRQSLARHQLAPRVLGIEVSESALIDDPEAAARTLRELVALDVAVAIDNFGTGYSSLASLQRFPVTTLKIDRSFVHRLPEDATSRSLVRGIVGLGVALGLDVVAEGVETEHQRRYAAELGCGSYQGYLRARPGSAEVITGLLESTAARPPTEPAPPQLG